MPTLADVVDLLHEWYPPETATHFDAVGLVAGDPTPRSRKVMFAVDPTIEVAREAVEWGADLLVVHHPLFLTPVSSVAATTPKGRTLHTLTAGGCALLTAHTNADQARVRRLGVAGARPRAERPRADPARRTPGSATGARAGGSARSTRRRSTTSRHASRTRCPPTAHGVRVAGDPDRPVRRVAVCGGAGDFLLDELVGEDVDVFVTSDLRHHRAGEFLEHGGAALVDVAHWAAEWTWLPVVEGRLREALGDRVETRVSTQCTDPWTFRH